MNILEMLEKTKMSPIKTNGIQERTQKALEELVEYLRGHNITLESGMRHFDIVRSTLQKRLAILVNEQKAITWLVDGKRWWGIDPRYLKNLEKK